MQRIAIITGDTHSYSNESSAKTAAHAFAQAAAPFGDVQTFDVKQGLDDFWKQTETFTAIVPLLYPLSEDDAVVLRELDHRNVPHLFSGLATQKLLTDRVQMKDALLSANVRTPAYQVIKSDKDNVQFPAVLYALSQPARGMWFATNKKELVNIFPHVQKFSERVLTEDYHGGLHYCVSVVENTQRGVRAMAPVFLRNIPDSERKHFDDPYIEPICPTNLSNELRQALQDEAMRAHAAIGARHFSHVQFTIDNASNHWLTDIAHSLVGNDTIYYELMPALNADQIEFADLVRAWLNEPSA